MLIEVRPVVRGEVSGLHLHAAVRLDISRELRRGQGALKMFSGSHNKEISPTAVFRSVGIEIHGHLAKNCLQ